MTAEFDPATPTHTTQSPVAIAVLEEFIDVRHMSPLLLTVCSLAICPASAVCRHGPFTQMSFPENVIEVIGATPLIKLRQASERTGCTILGKAEFMNPGGSVKDRAALAIVNDAITRGSLQPGGLIVEGTAGNTGIGLALVANALGYKTVIVIPDTQSQEK